MLTDSMMAERLRKSSHEFRVMEEAHHRLDLELIQLQVQTVVSLFQYTKFVTGLAQPFRNHTVCQHVAPPGYEIT